VKTNISPVLSPGKHGSAPQSFCIPPHFCYCRQMNWRVVVRRIQMSVTMWDAVHSHSMHRWVLSGAGVQAPWSACKR